MTYNRVKIQHFTFSFLRKKTATKLFCAAFYYSILFKINTVGWLARAAIVSMDMTMDSSETSLQKVSWVWMEGSELGVQGQVSWEQENGVKDLMQMASSGRWTMYCRKAEPDTSAWGQNRKAEHIWRMGGRMTRCVEPLRRTTSCLGRISLSV